MQLSTQRTVISVDKILPNSRVKSHVEPMPKAAGKALKLKRKQAQAALPALLLAGLHSGDLNLVTAGYFAKKKKALIDELRGEAPPR